MVVAVTTDYFVINIFTVVEKFRPFWYIIIAIVADLIQENIEFNDFKSWTAAAIEANKKQARGLKLMS